MARFRGLAFIFALIFTIQTVNFSAYAQEDETSPD